MIPVVKNGEYTVSIEDLTYEGMGVAKIENYPIFVANALPSEIVKIHITKTTKKFAFAKVVEWLEQSSDRTAVRDVKLTQTGIAPLQHITYSAQLSFKQKQVKECLHKVHLDDVTVHSTVPSPHTTKYRNKAQVPVRVQDGHFHSGFYRKNSHQFIAIEDFEIQDNAIDDALKVLMRLFDEFELTAYNEQKHEGVLRHVIIRRGYYSHEMMVILVTRKKHLFKGEQLARRIIEEIPGVVSVMQNINSERTNVIMGPVTQCLAGRDYIQDEMLNHTFKISAPSFYQVNTPQAEAMYQKAIDLAQLNSNMVALDAYCGIGTITLSIAPHVKEIYGIEVVEEAIENAKENARINHLPNAYFQAGKAEVLIHQLQRAGIQPDVIFVDPPRKGLDERFTQTMIELSPDKIAYISCNPATFARDAAILVEHDYRLDDVFPYDMFPQTTHVECVALFTKK